MPTHDLPFILWGRHPAYVDDATIGLTEGTLQHCRTEQRFREKDRAWLLGIYKQGNAPAGLRLLARAEMADINA